MRMKMKLKMAAMSVLLGALCFQPHACAAPQDNFWLESEWANLPIGPAYRVAWGHSVGFSTNSQIIIGDAGVKILVLTTNGSLVRSWAADVHDLDVSANGLIFAVVESQVKVFDIFGNTIRQWTLGFNSVGIGVGGNELVYVSEKNGNRVVVYNQYGDFVRQWGAYGNLPGQFAGDIHDVAVGRCGNVYVSDYNNWRIQVFSPEGTFRRSISAWYPIRVAVSPDEEVVLSSSAYSDIGSFTRDGQMRFAPALGKIGIYRTSYSTTGLRPPNAVPLPIVLRIEQRPGTTLVDVDFTILDPDNSTVNVAAVAFVNGQNDLASLIPMRTFEEGTGSALGTNAATGVNHRLTWNAAADWSTNFVNAQIEILAKDNRGLLDFHFLTVPATTNPAPLTISQFPVNDGDFLNAWVWLIASGNTNVLLTNGNVKGLSGAYTGQMLTSSSGTVTTTVGRLFLFSLLNVREATTDEYNRAKGSGVQWTPRFQIAGKPAKVNEFGFDTGTATANNYWVVPLP